MKLAKSIKLQFETLGERVLPSANSVVTPEPFVEVQQTSPTQTTPPSSPSPPSPSSNGSIITPIDPLGGLGGSTPTPALPTPNAANEATAAGNINQALTAVNAQIAALDPNSADYQDTLEGLQARRDLLLEAQQMTAQIAANMEQIGELVAYAEVLEDIINAYIANPSSDTAAWNLFIQAIEAYGQTAQQITDLLAATQQLIQQRNSLLQTLGVPSGY
jgi:hypothetical protein